MSPTIPSDTCGIQIKDPMLSRDVDGVVRGKIAREIRAALREGKKIYIIKAKRPPHPTNEPQ